MPIGQNRRRALKSHDFIENESFRRWVFQNTPVEAAYWPNYLAQHPEYRQSAELARTFLLTAKGELPEVTNQQVNEAVSRILSDAPSQPHRQLWMLSGWQPLRIAASIALVVTASWIGWQYWTKNRTAPALVNGQTASPKTVDFQEITNLQRSARLVRLPDGSLVVLQRQARIRFPKQFTGPKRDVFLTGNAFFEVVRNPAKPFRVFARELTTEVLGTSFLINAPEAGGQVNVVVKTGRVAVSTNPTFRRHSKAKFPRPAAVVLLPNQQAIFSTGDARLVKRTVSRSEASVLPATTKALSFRRTPLPQVMDALANAYGIEIRYNREELSGCSLTAHLDDPSLFARLDIIAASTGSTYQLQNGQLVIHSQGCR